MESSNSSSSRMQYPLPAKPSFSVLSSSSSYNSNSNGRPNPWLGGGSSSSSNEQQLHGPPGLSHLRELRGSLQRVQDTAESRQLSVRDAIAALSASSSSSSRANGTGRRSATPQEGRSRAVTPGGTGPASLPHSQPGPSQQLNRGTKRSRLDSESSLSPTSTTSTSSIVDTTNANHPVNHGLPNNGSKGTSSRAASPAGSALGLSSSRLSKAPSTNGPPASTGSSNKGKAPESQTSARLPKDGAIPGLNAPVPSLPGFRKKKKEASPSPASHCGSSARASPAPPNSHDFALTSTSTLPPAPSSLPPRPAGLPQKPPPPSRSSSYQAGHARDRERSSGRPDQDDSASRSQRDRTESWQSDSQHAERKRERSKDGWPLATRTNGDDAGVRSRSVSLSAGSPSAEGGSRSRSVSPLPPKPPSPQPKPKPIVFKEDKTIVPTVAVSSPPDDSGKDESSTKLDVTAGKSSEAVSGQSDKAAALASGEKAPAGPPVARKGLPPTSSSNTIKPSPAIQAVQASAAASGSSTSGPPSRPGTPLGRKALPPSVVVSSSLSKSASGLGKDKALLPGSPAQNSDIKATGKTKSPKPGTREAERHRKREEKKKRKLAALELSGAAGASGSGKVNGQGRQDSLPPNKQRRIEASPGDVGGSGLKVKLNGFSLNRSTTPNDGHTFAQPAPPKKTVSIPGVADDFSLPARSLVPAAPPIVIPTPTPSKQSEIDDDFDHAKPASQVPYTTFANWVHDYLRSFGEDDLAFLAAKSTADPSSEEAGNLYTVPDIGPHYLDAWAAMDAEADTPGTSTALIPPLTKRLKPENLTSEKLAMENFALGPLGERIMSAFRGTNDFQSLMQDLLAEQQEQQAHQPIPVEPPSASIPAAETMPQQISPPTTAPALFGHLAATAPTIKEMDVLSFESRLTRELGFLGAIPPGALATRTLGSSSSASTSSGTNPKKQTSGTIEYFESPINWANREDDEISCSLRACQRLLKAQVATNERRKTALAERVQARIAYQEYEALRDGLESVIEGAWAKRQRAAQRKAYKDKKDKDRKEKDRDKLEAASLAQSIAALNQPQPLSASLIAALTKRRNLVDGFAHLFPEGAGLLPSSSVYEGIELDSNVVSDPPQAAPSTH